MKGVIYFDCINKKGFIVPQILQSQTPNNKTQLKLQGACLL